MKLRYISFKIFIITAFFLLNTILHAQNITVIPNGIIEKGVEAVVTGNYVRVRSGPSLKDKIITKVNKGTEVIILERDKSIKTIGSKKNYWYKIKIKSKGITGWIYGAFLKARQKNNRIANNTFKTNTVKKLNPSSYISLQDLGTITGITNHTILAYGDLNNDEKDELITVAKTNRRGVYSVTGYNYNNNKFTEIYKTSITGHNIKKINLIKEHDIKTTLLIVGDDTISQIYIFDNKRRRLRSIYKIKSDFLSVANLDQKGSYIIYTKKNHQRDNDGTVTYFITIIPTTFKKGRFSITSTKITYNRPLPIKKLVCFDIDGDNKEEIILEVGGQQYGGGIIILDKTENRIKQLVNTGVLTYNSMPFIDMWGKYIRGNPKLIIYTTNPNKYGDVSTEFGFLFFSLETKSLIVERFYKVNKMLDEINNYRKIIPVKNSIDEFNALIADFNKKNKTISIKRPIF